MSESGKSAGRGRRIGSGDGNQPASPSTASASPASSGKGRGRGRAIKPPQQPGGGGNRGDVVAEPESLPMESMTLRETSAAAVPETATKPKTPAKAEIELVQAMKRPETGKDGRAINLFANHFPMRIPENMRVYHYDFAVGREFKRKKGSSTKSKKPTRSRKDEDDDDETASFDDVIGEDGDFEIVVRHRNKWPKWLSLLIYENFVNNLGVQYKYKMAFDGAKNIFAQCKLPEPAGGRFRLAVQIPDENRCETFIVTLKYVSLVDVNLREVFNRNLVERRSTSTLILDVILRQSKMFSNEFISMGPRAFYEQRNPASLGGGLWHYPGIWESVRPISGWKSTVNLNLANTAFVKSGPILGFLDEIARNWQSRRLEPREIKALEKFLKGLKIVTVHRPEIRSDRCIGVTKESANEITFQCEVKGGGTAPLTVAKYFEKMHEARKFVVRLQHPHLPCLHIGSKTKQTYIPLEMCHIQRGQRYSHKLSEQQTSAMLKIASHPAPERKRRIEEEAKHFGLDRDPYLANFGLTVELKMMELQGRVLQAPMIEWRVANKSQPRPIPTTDGKWKLMNGHVVEGVTIRSYGVINTDRKTSRAALERFCLNLIDKAEGLGIRFTNRMPVGCLEDDRPENIESMLAKLKEKSENTLDLVIVVVPMKNSLFYASAKAAGDVSLSVNTQCVLAKNVQKAADALLINLLLKINAKLGGINHKLQDASKRNIDKLCDTDPATRMKIFEPILFIGADVNHPAPTDYVGSPSVAAVVANVDMLPAQYAAKILIQSRRQEPIAELQKATQEMIYNFYTRNGRVLPRRIVMYRDGVGESMFLKVLTDELHAMRRACKEMGQYFKVQPYEPPITFIVVQKRHHTRLFCANDKDMTGAGKNVPPGTTVDTVIVHPEENDFYLCSHLGLQGTARPTHYRVLWDDSNFTADELQTLTYYLCYTYARSTTSVSIPPPCYYADLVAYRARQYLSWSWQSGSESGSSASSASTVDLAQLRQYVEVRDNIAGKGMYFI